MITFAFTYSTVTPESAEHGDHADHGYVVDGWKFSANDDEIREDMINVNPDSYREEWKRGSGLLTHMVKLARGYGICEASDSEIGIGTWFSSTDPEQNYETGEDTSYSFHVDGVTLSTLRRICRLLNCTNIFGRVMRDKDLAQLAPHAYHVIANDTTLPEEHTTQDMIALLRKAFPRICNADARALFNMAKAL